MGRPGRGDRDGRTSEVSYCGEGDDIGDGGGGGGEASRTPRFLIIAVWLACAALT